MGILKFVYELIDLLCMLYVASLLFLFVFYGGRWKIGTFINISFKGLIRNSKRTYRGE